MVFTDPWLFTAHLTWNEIKLREVPNMSIKGIHLGILSNIIHNKSGSFLGFERASPVLGRKLLPSLCVSSWLLTNFDNFSSLSENPPHPNFSSPPLPFSIYPMASSSLVSNPPLFHPFVASDGSYFLRFAFVPLLP